MEWSDCDPMRELAGFENYSALWWLCTLCGPYASKHVEMLQEAEEDGRSKAATGLLFPLGATEPIQSMLVWVEHKDSPEIHVKWRTGPTSDFVIKPGNEDYVQALRFAFEMDDGAQDLTAEELFSDGVPLISGGENGDA